MQKRFNMGQGHLQDHPDAPSVVMPHSPAETPVPFQPMLRPAISSPCHRVWSYPQQLVLGSLTSKMYTIILQGPLVFLVSPADSLYNLYASKRKEKHEYLPSEQKDQSSAFSPHGEVCDAGEGLSSGESFSHTGRTGMASLQCGSAGAVSELIAAQSNCHTLRRYRVSPLCGLACVFSALNSM